MRLRACEVRGVHELVEQTGEAVRGEIGVVPLGGPPGIRKESQAVPALAQQHERFACIREDGAPARDRTRVAVERREERALVGARAEAPEPVAYDAGGRAAPLLAFDPLPVRLLGRAHRGDELLSRCAGAVMRRAHGVVRTLPLRGRTDLPIRPVHERATEVEHDGARLGHARSGMRALTAARRISRPMRSDTAAMSGASARSVSSFGTCSRITRRASSTPGAVVAPSRSRPCAPHRASMASASRVLRTTAASFSAACTPMLTWSSMPADVGTDSTDAGNARSRFSVTSAALVYWATMKPEFVPALGLRNGGSPLVCAFVRRSTRASLMSASSATAIVATSSAIATGWPWKLPPLTTRRCSANTSGLSVTELISISMTRRA